MAETTNRIFIIIVVLVVILTAFLTWRVSEWQNNANIQNSASVSTFNTPNGNAGKININLIPSENTESE